MEILTQATGLTIQGLSLVSSVDGSRVVIDLPGNQFLLIEGSEYIRAEIGNHPSPKSFQLGSKAHVADCAKLWLLAREVEGLVRNDEGKFLLAGSLTRIEEEFWDAARLALAENACVPAKVEG